MAHYDIFRHHLLNKYPGYGHALWDPNPGNLYPAVEVGDVGYIREGKFRRLFNVLLPGNHPSHSNFGVPEYHEQLTLNMGNHIDIGTLSPHDFYSAGVTLGPESDRLADGPKKEGEVTFRCPKNQGAVLCLPIEARREDTVATTGFGKWMVKHIDQWLAWARQLELGVDRMEDIVLVTGTHRTRSCTNVAFPGGQDDAQASFGAKVDRRGDIIAINWQFSRERNRGAVLNCGPDGQNLPEDQCIFVRGFRVTRKFKILPRLKGAAGPSPDADGHDEEPDVELVPIPAVPEYHDPLHILLKFITETSTGAPQCDMVLVHDNDLARLHEIQGSEGAAVTAPLESLQSDALLSHLRSVKPKIHRFGVRRDLLSASKRERGDTKTVWAATLSPLFDVQLAHASSIIGRNSKLQPQPDRINVTVSHKSLYIDGYISQTFGPHQAQQYFLDFLKINSLPPIESLSYPNRESHLFHVGPITRHIPIQPFRTSSRLLDRSVVSRGPVVPQTMWSPHAVVDKKQHTQEPVMEKLIFFEGTDGVLGLSLEDAAGGRRYGLRHAPTAFGYESITHIRILWPGYKDFGTRETSRDDQMTIQWFAYVIGQSVDAFLSACELDPGAADSENERWRIGPGGIQRSDIIVIGAIHVSAGSWMPLLQLNRYIL